MVVAAVETTALGRRERIGGGFWEFVLVRRSRELAESSKLEPENARG